MHTYTVLGATGSTGSAILRYLHERPDKVNVNIYARSASKLQQMHPYIRGASNIKCFVGELSNPELLKDCLKGSDAVFCAVAQNSNEPGCTIAQRTAQAVSSGLEALRAESRKSFVCPPVVFLSSAMENPVFVAATPTLMAKFLWCANYHVYTDLRKAIEYLQDHSWIPLIEAQPPAIVEDISRGWELSEVEVSALVSYDDLGRAMVQMAEEEGGKKWAGKGVGIKSTGNVKANIWPLVKLELSGLLGYFLPSIWKWGSGTLW